MRASSSSSEMARASISRSVRLSKVRMGDLGMENFEVVTEHSAQPSKAIRVLRRKDETLIQLLTLCRVAPMLAGSPCLSDEQLWIHTCLQGETPCNPNY